jgi:hypothetical protein
MSIPGRIATFCRNGMLGSNSFHGRKGLSSGEKIAAINTSVTTRIRVTRPE